MNEQIEIIEYSKKYEKEVIKHISEIAMNEFGYSDWAQYFEKLTLDEYEKLGSKFWIALNSDGEIIGSIGALKVSDDEVYLGCLYINKNYRGRGIGKKLYGVFFDFVEEEKYKSIRLRTYLRFKTAILIYEKLGFEKYKEDEESYFYRKCL